MKRHLTIALTIVMVLALASAAFAYGNAGADVSAKIVNGNNWNQGELLITVTDNRGGYTETVKDNPGNGTDNYNVGPYIVALSVQGNSFSVSITGHTCDYDQDVTDPTCVNAGFTTNTCYICDDWYTDDDVEATGHDYVTDTVDATCTEDGAITVTCNNCEYEDVTVIDATDHDYVTDIVDATCTEDGAVTVTCSNCEYEDVTPIEAFGHDWQEVTTLPNCSVEGQTTMVCANECGTVWGYWWDYTDPLGHVYEAPAWDNWGWWIICEVCPWQGYISYVYCDYAECEYEAIATANCWAGGWDRMVCVYCADEYQGGWQGALGHDFVKCEETSTVPTCWAGGGDWMVCDTCTYAEWQNWYGALGHDFGTPVRINELWDEVFCEREGCGYSEYREPVLGNVVLNANLAQINANPGAYLQANGKNTWVFTVNFDEVYTNGYAESASFTVNITGNNITNNYNIGSHSFDLGNGYVLELRFQGNFNPNNSYIRIVQK